jgi:hypothetical protein
MPYRNPDGLPPRYSDPRRMRRDPPRSLRRCCECQPRTRRVAERRRIRRGPWFAMQIPLKPLTNSLAESSFSATRRTARRECSLCGFRALLLSCARRRPGRGPRDAREGRRASAARDSCFSAKEQSWRAGSTVRSLLGWTISGSAASSRTERNGAAASRQKERRERTARLRTISTPMPWREAAESLASSLAKGRSPAARRAERIAFSQLALEPWTQPC